MIEQAWLECEIDKLTALREVDRALAEILSHRVRRIDTSARCGGDELALMLPESNMPAACLTAERQRLAVAQSPLRLAARLAQVAVEHVTISSEDTE